MTLRRRILLSLAPLVRAARRARRRRARAARPHRRPHRRHPARELRQRPRDGPAQRGAGADRLVVPVRPGRPGGRRPARQYAANWPRVRRAVRGRGRTTSPSTRSRTSWSTGCGRSTADYRRAGRRVLRPPGRLAGPARGLLRPAPATRAARHGSRRSRTVSGEILRINQENMEQASDDARATARTSLLGFGGRRWPWSACCSPAAGVVPAPHHPRPDPRRDRRGPARSAAGQPRPDGAGARPATSSASWPAAFNAMTRAAPRTTASRTSPGCCAPSRPARRPSTRSPTRSWSSTPAGRVELANPAARQLLGVGPRPTASPARRGSRPSRSASPLADALAGPAAVPARGVRPGRRPSGSAARTAPSCRRSCRSATPTATRSGPPSCSTT